MMTIMNFGVFSDCTVLCYWLYVFLNSAYLHKVPANTVWNGKFCIFSDSGINRAKVDRTLQVSQSPRLGYPTMSDNPNLSPTSARKRRRSTPVKRDRTRSTPRISTPRSRTNSEGQNCPNGDTDSIDVQLVLDQIVNMAIAVDSARENSEVLDDMLMEIEKADCEAENSESPVFPEPNKAKPEYVSPPSTPLLYNVLRRSSPPQPEEAEQEEVIDRPSSSLQSRLRARTPQRFRAPSPPSTPRLSRAVHYSNFLRRRTPSPTSTTSISPPPRTPPRSNRTYQPLVDRPLVQSTYSGWDDPADDEVPDVLPLLWAPKPKRAVGRLNRLNFPQWQMGDN
uniref:Extensin-like n=1 Tax=Panagrellus redivivus TaxID=6233 RepID=A0A7E4W2A6_PANRE